MTEYLPPCALNACDRLGSNSESNQRLCKDMAACIIGAGGAGLLEITLCPMKALMEVGPEQDDVRMRDIRSKLGIVGYYERSDLDY